MRLCRARVRGPAGAGRARGKLRRHHQHCAGLGPLAADRAGRAMSTDVILLLVLVLALVGIDIWTIYRGEK